MLVLRFSNFERPTIDEHMSIVAKAGGSVWWGWWKKVHEGFPERLHQVSRLVEELGQVDLGLVERASGQFFVAACDMIAIQGGQPIPSPEPSLTPAYYRDEKFPAWFRFTSIRAVDQGAWETQFGLVPRGDPTIYEAQRPRPDVPTEVIEAEVESTSGVVVHISDLHFGSDHGYPTQSATTVQFSLLDRILRSVPSKPACLVVSGDLTTKGDYQGLIQGRQFVEKLRDAFGLPTNAVVIAPGNHDILISETELTRDFSNEQPFRDLTALFYGRAVPNERIHDIRDAKGRHFILGVLNSSRPRHLKTMDYGYVGIDRSEPVFESLGKLRLRPRDPVWAAVVLHHHILSAAMVEEPERERPVSMTLDAGELVALAHKHGVNAMLHGHQHMPFVGQVQRLAEFSSDGATPLKCAPVRVLGAGSAGARVDDNRIPQEVNANSVSYYEPFGEEGFIATCVEYLARRNPRVAWSIAL